MKYKVFLINMKKATDRYLFMSEQLKKQGLEFTVQEGIDGEVYNFDSFYDEEYGRKIDRSFIPLNSREKGISLSHKTILEKMLEENLDYALVLEDDVELPNDFKNIIETEIKNRDENKTKWEYLSFNYPSVGLKFIQLWLFLFKRMFRKNESIIFYFKLPFYSIKFILIVLFSIFEGARDSLYKKMYKYGKVSLFYRPLYLAGCYLVNREGANKLVSLNTKLTYTADRLPNVARVKSGLKYYAFVPLLVKQRRDKFWNPVLNDDKENYFNN